MEKIERFKTDCTQLQRGIYVARKDYLEGGGVITTFDIRMKLPNREPAVSQSALHTIEHLAIAFLRNHPVWKDKILYWGPMGGCTGNNLLVKGDLTTAEIAPVVKETFEYIANYEEEIPGANVHDCGNYMLNNLPMARWEAKKYLVEVLENLSDENLNYPA